MCLKISRKNIFAAAVLVCPLTTMAAQGFYIQGQGGFSGWSANDSSNFKIASNHYAVRGSAGYMWNQCYTPWSYGIEIGFADYPRLLDEVIDDYDISLKVNVRGYSIDTLGVLKYNVDPKLSLFGKAGLAYLHEKAHININHDFKDNVVGHTFAPELVLGMGYRINRNLEANLSVSEIFAGDIDVRSNNPTSATSTLMAGLTYYIS